MKKIILFLIVLITINFIFISAESCNNTDECSIEENDSLNENVTVNAKIIQTVDEDGTINLNLEIEKEKNETEETTSGITGAVTGFMKSGAGKGFVVIALMLIAGMGFMILRKKKNSKKENISEEINKKTLKQ